MALTKSKKLRLISFILIIFLQTILIINFAAADSSLPLSFCDSGDLQTLCVINDIHYLNSNENVFNANNLVITGTGKLASNISMDFLIELTGNLTIEPRGVIELGASNCDSNTADSGSKLTIIADVVSLIEDSALRVKGSGNNEGSIINITANALLLNGNNIFYTENLILDIANSFDIKGSAFAGIGAGDNNDCAINFDVIETNESVNPTNETSQNAENKAIEINLEYNADSPFDDDNDGLETTTGVVDLTVKNTGFNWEADEGRLCTRWHSYSIDKEETTVLCYGNERCCDFIGLSPTRSDWNETFYSYYGLYSATLDNLISAQVLYVDYNLSLDNPYSDIVYSEWRNLTARYYSADIVDGNVCNQKCIVTGFNASSYSLSCEANDASSEIYNAEYEAEEELGKDPVLINSIPNITINEGSDYAIDLSEYFLDEDNDTLNFDYYKSAENASIYFDENIAVIEPYKGFTGDIYMFFIANDSYSTANSNIFTVSVIESNATSYSTRQWQAFISAQLDSGFCDSGDLLTTCVISTTKKLNSTQNILNANNVVITNTGKLYNNTDIHFILNLTGNLTIMPGGSIELDGSLCSSRNCYNGGNLTIYADAVNLTADSLITANGANLPENKINKNNKGSGDGGVINISANAFYSDGSISLDGGSHSGTKWGNGGSGGTLNLDIENGFDINGNVYARGGTGNNKSCGVISGHIGDGGIANIVNKNANIVSGVILTNPGSVGKCLDGVYRNSEIYAQKITINANRNFLVAGVVNASNITIEGVLGPKDNGKKEPKGTRNLGANLTIIADVLNLSSDGLISGEGADYNSDAEDFAGSGANLNIIANTLHLDGSINVDGGNHAGGRRKGSGGNAGSLNLDIKNSFNIRGSIFARGGTADGDSCGARIGNNGNGGIINILNKNVNLIDGLIETNPSAIGGCINGVYRNSEIYANKIIVHVNQSFLVAGIVNATNITIDGTFGPKDNGNNEPAGKRNLGANLTIIADVLNLSSDGLISGEGDSFEIGAKRFAGAGANVDVLADTLIFRGRINVDGGSHKGGSSSGNGGNAGSLKLDVKNSFNIRGSIFARGGTGDNNSCGLNVGNRGNGGIVNIVNKNVNILRGAIEANPGLEGGCGNGVYRNSEIYAQKITINANRNFLVAGVVNTSNITIEGTFGPKENGNNEPAGKRNLGANLTIIADTLNLSSNGLISGEGADYSIGIKRFAGAGADIDILANTVYFDGNISIDGGSHRGGKATGNGGHAGTLNLDIINSFDINGGIFARGGTGDADNCDSKTGNRGNGGIVNIVNKNVDISSGAMETNPGFIGGCNNGVYKSSAIFAKKIIVKANQSFLVAGIVNSSNITIEGAFGPKDNGNNEAAGKRNLGANLTIIADTLNLSSDGLISGEGADFGIGIKQVAGAGANVEIAANTLHMDGDINLNGGSHRGGKATGNGGDAGTLNLDIENRFDINGNVYARGGTGDTDNCDSKTGNRGDGGIINIVNKNANLIDGLIETNPSAIGGCINGVYKNSEIYANKIIVHVNQSFLVAGIVNASNITIEGVLGPKENGNNEPAGKRNLGVNLTIIADVLNLSSNGLISGNGASHSIVSKRHPGAGANVEIAANTLHMDGDINLNGGSQVTKKNSGNGAHAGSLRLGAANRFEINGDIYARGGQGNSKECSAKKGDMGGRGDGGLIEIAGDNDITLNGYIDLSRGDAGKCNNGEGGSASVNASNNLNLSSAARINTTGNMSGDINLKGSAVKIAGTLISSNSIGNSSVDNGTILIEFNKSLNISQLKSLPSPQIARYNEFGRVRFKNNINNFETISFNSNITINANMIEVDSKSARELNQSALINLYSLNGFGVLSINRNGFEDCLNSSSSDLRCTLISDRNNLDNVEFNVTSFTGYSVKPSGIRLESPANGTTDTDGIVAFKCSANGDVNLANITLYHNISGRGSGNSELSANFTFDAAGNNNSSVDNTSSWMISGVEDGIYSWNCLGYENLSSYAFADDDFMFMVNKRSVSISENTESTALASIVRYEGGGGCIYTWQCSDWTGCSENGIQTRTCTNMGTCLGDYSKPAEIQDCVYTAKEQEHFAAQETPAQASPPQSKKGFLSTLTGAVISALTSSNGSAAMIALILAGAAFYAGYSYLYMEKKNNKKKSNKKSLS